MGFCEYKVAYKLSADTVGVGTIEPHSTTTQQGQDRTCGRHFPALLIGSEYDPAGPGPEVENDATMDLPHCGHQDRGPTLGNGYYK
jgi:hypothetical protein